MLPLVASLVALVGGPLLLALSRRQRPALAALDGFTFVAILGLVTGHILWESATTAGWLALPVAVLGFVGPGLLERSLHSAARHAHAAALVLALIGVGLHAFGDGLGLASSGALDAAHRHSLPLAVILHRLPVGLTVWWLLRPVYGARWAVAVLGGIGAATVAGFLAGEGLAHLLEGPPAALVRALVAGSLLHVVVHRPGAGPVPAAPHGAPSRTPEGLGGLAALALLLLVSWESLGHGGESRFFVPFLHLAGRLAPWLFAAWLTGTVLSALPVRRPAARGPSKGGAFGEALAGCARGLRDGLRRGGPESPGAAGSDRGPGPLARRLTAGSLGSEALVLSVACLGWPLALIRAVGGLLAALVPGWRVGRLLPRVDGEAGEEPAAPTIPAWWQRGLARSDRSFPPLLLGLALAALAWPVAQAIGDMRLGSVAELILFALAGLPLSLSAAGVMAPAWILLAAGFGPGPVVAFLVTAPTLSLAGLTNLARRRGAGAAILLAAQVLLLALIAGRAAELIAPAFPALALGGYAEPLETGWRTALLAVLGAAGSVSLVHQGPRRFVGRVLPAAHPEGHDHGPGTGAPA